MEDWPPASSSATTSLPRSDCAFASETGYDRSLGRASDSGADPDYPASQLGATDVAEKRFGQEIDRSALHGPHGHRNVAMAAHENDRNMNVRLGRFGLEVETA